MKTTIHHGKTTVHRGRSGSHVEVHLHAERAGEWSGIYPIASHGMSAEQFLTRIDTVKAYHAAKMDRLNGFVELRQRDIAAGNLVYRIGDCNIRERGSDVELVVGVDWIKPSGERARVLSMNRADGFIYPSLDAAPDDDAIEQAVRARLIVLSGHADSHAAFLGEVARLVEA